MTTTTDPRSTDIYLVWSNEHVGWWKPGGYGYSTALEDAGHFTRERAIDISRRAIPGSSSLGMLPEIPVRLLDLADMLKAHWGNDA